MRGALPSRASRKTRTQGGSAIIFILLGIALFAALCYAFMRGMQGGTGSFSTQQSKIIAQEIINSSLQVERGVQKLLRRGCSQDDISMEKAPSRVGLLWENSNAPTDKSCHLFEPEGAGLSDIALDTGTGTTAYWVFSGHLGMSNINPVRGIYGIAAYLRGLSDSVCISVNQQMGTGWSLIPSYTTAYPRMHYNPSLGEGIIIGAAHYITCDSLTHPDAPAEAFCPVKNAGCFNLNGENVFYHYVSIVPD